MPYLIVFILAYRESLMTDNILSALWLIESFILAYIWWAVTINFNLVQFEITLKTKQSCTQWIIPLNNCIIWSN